MKTDVHEHDDHYDLDIDLPGFAKDEISISLENGMLTVAAAKGLDLVVFVGTDNARHMIEAARTMGVGEERIESYPSSDAALAALKDRFTTRDLVLVKGSRFMGLDAFARGVLA